MSEQPTQLRVMCSLSIGHFVHVRFFPSAYVHVCDCGLPHLGKDSLQMHHFQRFSGINMQKKGEPERGKRQQPPCPILCLCSYTQSRCALNRSCENMMTSMIFLLNPPPHTHTTHTHIVTQFSTPNPDKNNLTFPLHNLQHEKLNSHTAKRGPSTD